MTDRLFLVLGAALLIFWQSGCMSIADGLLMNRCGLWQWVTNKPMVIALGGIPEKVVDHIVEHTVIQHDGLPGSSGSTITITPGTGVLPTGRVTLPQETIYCGFPNSMTTSMVGGYFGAIYGSTMNGPSCTVNR